MMQSDKKGRVLVTGGTGFVGRSIVRRLDQAGWRVRMIARQAPSQESQNQAIEFHKGNVLDPASVRKAAQGCVAVIHLVGIIRETRTQSFQQAHVDATENVINAALDASVRRYVHISALGAGENAASSYHRTKWRAEQLVRASKLNWTIFRPGLIHGPQGEFTQMVIGWHDGKIPPFIFIPFFGGGLLGQQAITRVQPILVSDLAELFVRALETPVSEYQTYQIGGPEMMTWPAMLEVFNRVLPGPRRPMVGIPFWLANVLSALRFPGLPFNRDQVIMAGEDNVCDLTVLKRDFPDFSPQALESSMREYL